MLSELKNTLSYFCDSFKYINFNNKYLEVMDLLKKQKKAPYKNRRILAVYDFIDMVHSNDISSSILQAEIVRRKYNLEKIDFLIISDANYPLNAGCNPTIDTENYKHIIYNLVLEYTRIFNTIGSIIILDNRNQAIDYIKFLKNKYYILYPHDYNPELPIERINFYDRAIAFHMNDYDKYAKKDPSLNYLTVPKDQLVLARKWLKKYVYPKIPITISLRETTSSPVRNSRIDEWQKFVNLYENDDRFIFIIMRDYYELYTSDNITGKNVIYCNEAVLSFSFRAALFQESTLSMFVANGVAMLGWYNKKANYLNFRVGVEKELTSSRKFTKELSKLNYLDNWHGATKYQKLVWEQDTVDIIDTEFKNMISLLEKDNKLYPNFYSNDKIESNEIQKPPYHEIYQNDSRMSKRISIFNYVLAYKIMYFLRKFIKFPICLEIQDIKITSDTKILFYGAGTITKKLIPIYKNNIPCIIDAAYEVIEKKDIEGIPILPLEKIDDYSFDYIFVTPKNRELEIMLHLQFYYNIPTNKFLVTDKIRIQQEYEDRIK